MGTARRMKSQSANHTAPLTPLRTTQPNGFSKLANKTDCLSKVFGKIGRAERRNHVNNETNPGPHHYSPKKQNIGGDTFGAKIGSSIRKGMAKTDRSAPAPNYYYPRHEVCEKTKNNWNFGSENQRPFS